MAINDKIRQLYTAMKADGADVGTEQEFSNFFLAKGDQGYKNRKAVWDAFKADGADVGENYEEFAGWLGIKAAKPQQPHPKPNPYKEQRQQEQTDYLHRPVSQQTMAESMMNQPEFEASYDIGNGQRRKVNEDIEFARKSTEFTPRGQQFVDEEGNVVKEVKDVYPLKPNEVAYDEALRNAGPTMEEQNQQRLEQVNKELAKVAYDEERVKNNALLNNWPMFIAQSINMAGSSAPGASMDYATDESSRRKLLEARQHLLSEGQNIVQEVRREAQEGEGIGTGIMQGLRNTAIQSGKKSTWDFGATELNTQSRVLDAIIRMDNGEALTEDERDLLDDFALKNGIDQRYNDQLTGWAKAGQTTGDAFGYMFEMLINPANRIVGAVRKGAMKYALKKYGKEYVEKRTKGLMAKMITAKTAGTLGGILGGGAAMAVSTGALKTMANAEERMHGDVLYNEDENGKVVYGGHEEGNSALEAFSKAIASQTFEYGSEMAGEFLPVLHGYFGKMIGKAAIGKKGREALRLTGDLTGVDLNRAQKFVYDVAANKGIAAFNKGLDNFLKKTEWHGPIGEYEEELLNNFANILTGDTTFDAAENTGVFNPELNKETFFGVAFMGGAISVWRTGKYVGGKAYNAILDKEKKVNEANQKLFGDRWDTIKTAIDTSSDDPKELNNVITDILDSKDFDNEQKKAALKYTASVLEHNGADMAMYQPRMDNSTVMKDGKGYTTTSYDKNGQVIDQQTFATEDEAKAYQQELKTKRDGQDFKDYFKMSHGLTYQEGQNLITEFMQMTEFDKLPDSIKMNVLADMQNPEKDVYKDFQDFKLEKRIEKAKASQAAIAEFEQQQGWEPGSVQWLSEQDPMMMDDEMAVMAKQASDFVKSIAYPSTEVHTEIEEQDGAETANEVVENVVSTTEPIDPMNNPGKDIVESWAAAQAAAQTAFNNDERLKEEVERGESMGLSPQEIISSLDWARPAQRQAMVDYYNAKARYDSYMNTAAKKIDEEASRKRNQRKFTGTIDGKANVQDLIYITDGQNQYALVSGNITTEPNTGQVTDSDSGMILAVDQNGDYVTLGDNNGLTVAQSGMTLDQYEEQERELLQQQVTMVSDPNGTLMQQEAEVQSNAEGEAGAVNGTGANEPSAPSVAPQTEQTQIPVDEKTGVKLYEQGVPVDQAIADLQKDGRDVAAWADLAINEAQEELGKMKQPKTRAELVKNEARVKELQTVIDYYNKVKQRWAEMNAEAQSVEQPQKPTLIKSWQTNKGRKVELFIMPETVDEDGNRHVKIGRSIDGGEISTGHTNGIDVSTGLIDYEATYAGNDEVEERDKEDGTRYIVTEVIYLPDGRILARGTIAGDKASFWLKGDPLAPANSEENANVQLKEPIVQEKPASSQSNAPTVEEQKQQRIAEAKAKYGDLFDDDFTKANDVNELVSMWVGRKRNLAWDDVNGKRGLQKELGWTRKIGGDTKYIETLLAKNGEGVGVDEFVHMVWESPENDVMGEKRWSTEEIKESLLDLLKNAQSKSDVVDFALNNRIAQAEAALQQQQMMEAEAETQQEEIPANEQPINEGGIPFAPATEEEITNSVNENNNVAENNVSLQTENNTSNEQTSMGSPNQEGNGISEEDAGASDVLRRVSIAASETGQGGGSKERLLAQLEESAKDSGYWIDDDISQIDDLKVNVGGENEVYKTEDGKDAIKLNNFAFLRDDATNFEDFINRVESFNDLFPDVALQVIGFAKNSKGEVCVVLQQPWIEAEREATEAEIDDALEELDFYTDITGNWTDGKYEVTDLKPNNVLVDKEGNLHFIDVITFDSSKPGVLMRPKKPVEQKSPKQEQEKKAPTVNQAYAPNEEEYGDIKAWLELHPGASVAEIQRHFKIGYSKATIAKQRFDNEKAARPETDDYLKPRDAEEEKIVEDIHNQLQQEIQAAIGEVNKARFELQKAQAKESDRATDLFGNDNAMNQEGQLFDNSDMPVDQTIEGVERRTSAQREKLQAAQNKLNKLQSAEERNSRIRGALDNKRRQTSFDEIDERHKREYEQYIKPLLDKSDEELQQLKKAKEDAVGGDMTKLAGDKEYSAIVLVLTQREANKAASNKGKVNVSKNERGETEYRTKQGNWAYQVTEYNKNNIILIDHNLILTGEETAEGASELYKELEKLGEWKQGISRPGMNENNSGWIIPKDKADELDRILREHLEKLPEKGKPRYNPNPIEAMEQAANQFRQEQKEKKPKSNNKIFTDDAHEEVLKKLRAKFNNLNSGFDPEIALLMLQDAGYHIEKGARKIAECAKAMIEELGDFVRPYIKSAYNAVRDYPGMEDIAKDMSSFDEVQAFDVQNFDKVEKQNNPNVSDNTVNDNKNVLQGQENNVNLQQKQNNNDNDSERERTPEADRMQREGDSQEGAGGENLNSPTGVSQGEPSGAEATQKGRLDSNIQERGNDRQGNSGVQSGNEQARSSSGRSNRPVQGLNKNNNHEERGTESAPTSTIGRIEANIEAIELMQKLMEEGRPATDEEKKVLRQFSGWGGLGAAFANPVYQNKIRELLGDEGYEQANMSRNSAYYTPAKIIDRLWDIARALGFKGGNVLEGSAGIGKIIGLMPTDLSESSHIQAVEIDETTGNILKLLYPDAQVDIQGFEETKIPNGSVDLAITNVPFVTGLHVKDNSGDGDLSKKFGNIHDFCIAKNIRKLKEGGIGIFITSKGTLDDSQNLREWISAEGNADVVGAFRLNNETFGGTPVTSDIIIVRKRVNGNKSANAIDVALPAAVRTAKYDTGKTKKVKNPETGRKEEVRVYRDMSLDYNGYFIEHPEHMGGEMAYRFEKDLDYQPTSKACFPVEGKNQDALLDAWVKELQAKDWSQEQTVETEEAPVNNYEQYGEGVKEGSLILDSKGNVCIARYGQAVPLDTNDKKVKGQTKQQCLKDYTAIKNALQAVLDYQMNNEGNDGLQPLLDKLNKAYDQFVRKYGHFHGNTAIAFLRNDVDYASVGALETYREKLNADGTKTPVYGKADVFSKRVVEKEKEPQPTTIKDGVIASIYKFGGIDIPYIAKQLGLSEEEAKKQILDNELGYENPDTMQVDVSYVYLSGNVREKLQKARDNNVGGKYAKNISALEKVIPADIPAHLIEFNLGSTWIENKLYTDFFQEKTGKKVTCRNLNGGWVIDIPDGWTPKEGDGAVISEMCDKTIYTSQLIAAAMQGKTIKVQKIETRRDPWGNKTSETITDKEATQACAARIEELKAEFKDWARAKMQADPELSERTEKTYNDRFNNYAMMEIPDEYSPLRYGGQTTTLGKNPFSLLPHQSKAVIKGVTQPVLYAHEVGSGKTFTLITTAMEMRRIGTAKKPMIVVQNATVGQFTESAKQLYPGAKILTMDDDHSEAARKAFYAKIKYNDWDLIIISQSVLDKIPDNPDRQIAFIRQKIDEKEMVLEQLRANKESGLILKQMENEIDEMEDEISGLVEQSRERQEKKRKRDEKKRAVAKQNAAVRAKEQLDRSVDDVDDFDDMDIDAILVDEAHGYKKLGFESVMTRVKGVDTGSSKKCASLFLKTRAVLEKSNGKNVVFATGTPVSNTAAEVWTFMRYLMPPDVMKEYGIYYFDDFARNFGNVQQMLEFTTSGKFKENNRFAGYVNMPELGRIWTSVADIMTNKEVEEGRKERNEESKLPEVEGGKATDLYLPQTKALRSIMKKVRYILEQYENMSGKEKKRNSHIPLVAYGIAKAAAVDARLVDGEAEDDPNSKTNEAVRQTLKSLKETESYKGTVALFADNYQNKHTGFNLYQDIKKKLIEQGVPENQIAIISGSPKLSDKKKLEIFDKVNKGEIRVVLGSTFTLGTGVNIQERLHTLIHIDAPNRPMDYDQRNGRIVRQGNLHKVWGIPVRILRFGVEDSLDVTAYQRLKTKGAIADSVMESKVLAKNAMDSRVLEEEEDVFGDMTAQLSGSEYAMLKNQAEKDVRKLEAKKKQHEADQIFIHAQLPRLKGQNREAEGRIEQYKEALAKVTEASKNGTTIEIGEGKYDSLDAMTEFFTNYNSKIREIENNMRKEGKIATQRRELTVKINGFDIKFTTVIDAGSKLEKGRMVPFTTRNVSYSCDELWGNASFTCKGGYIKNGIEEILNETMTGNDYTEAIETAQNTIDRNNQQIKALEERQGRDFTEEEALQKAKDRLEEYTQKMKEEMEAKEAKYKEMDAEVEAAGDLDWDNDDDEADSEEVNKSVSYDPLEALNDAAERWNQDNIEMQDSESNSSNVTGIEEMIYGMPKKYGFKGTAITQFIKNRDELEKLRGVLSEKAFKSLLDTYNNPINEACYIPQLQMVVIFGERIKDKRHGESTWWHEQTHKFWHSLSDEKQREYGLAAWDFLGKYFPNTQKLIQKKYKLSSWYNEGCSFLIAKLINQYGTDDFLLNDFEYSPEISKFVAELKYFIKNGRKENEEGSDNRPEQMASVGRSAGVSEHGNLRGRDNKQDGLEREEEIDRSVGDPLEAISEAAERWRESQKDASDIEKSVKELYTETLDKESYVWTEAWQDSMLALKVFQNAALRNGEQIADSQNAYMFENLMHGKTKNEQDLYNLEYRDPLLNTVNRIMKKMTWTMRDMNRYLLTKSGLERNRELFVRDWLEEERKHVVNDYNELNEQEQEIYDRLANRIETDFEDGTITEEQKNRKLQQAVNAAHQQYLSDLEREWDNIKGRWNRRGSSAYSFADYIKDLTDFIHQNIDEKYKPEKYDYSGLTEMYGDENGKYDETAIIENLTNDEKKIGDKPSELADQLWQQIKEANRYALERYREDGMRSDAEIDRIEKMFNFYVPMRGFEDATAEDMYQYFTSKTNANSYVGGLIKHAKGRESIAKSPLSTMFGMAYKAIKDCNQNLMLQRFYLFCQAHPNDLTVLGDAWAVWNEAKQQWVETWPEIPDDATEDEARKAMLDYESEMKQLSREGKARKINGKVEFDYKPIDKKHKAEHTVEVRINGQKKLITVVGNPRLAQALNGHTRWENGRNIVSKVNARIKNMMSSAFTSYSPTFAARNMLRDWTHFRMMLSVREGEGYAKAATRYYKETFPRPWHKNGKIGMVKLFKKYRSGTLDLNNEVERDFKDFMDNGGVTGYVQMKKIDEMEREIKKMVGDRSDSEKKIDKAKYWLIDNLHLQGTIDFTDKVWNSIIGLVEAYNEAIENNARFATYRASRHYGNRTKARSAYDAKEITVNFNRKGSGAKVRNLKNSSGEVTLAAESAGLTSQVIGEGRIFNNATVQAIATTFKNFKNPDGSLNWPYIRKWAERYATPPFMFGIALPFINMALAAIIDGGDGDDDDAYANLPEWTRRKNICIYIGDGNFITLPIGQELAAFLTLGDIVAGMTYAPNLEPVDKNWLDEVRGVLNTFSPIDLETKVTNKEGLAGLAANTVGRLSSVLAPVVAVSENIGWTGRPIYKEDKYANDEFKPEYQQVYQSTNPLLVKASKKLHELGGGNDRKRGAEWSEVNPATVQYMWEQYTGGPGKLFSNTISLGKDAGDLIGQLLKGEGIDTDFNMRKVEGLKAFVQQGDEKTQYYRAQSKFYKYEREANKFKYDNDITNLEKQAKNNDPAAVLELESLKKGEDYTKYAIIKEANHSDKRKGVVGLDEMRKEIAKTTDRKEKRKLQNDYNVLMKQTVDKLDSVGE